MPTRRQPEPHGGPGGPGASPPDTSDTSAGASLDPSADAAVSASLNTLIAEPPAGDWIPRAVAYTAPLDAPAPSMPLDDPDLPYWLALNRVKGIGLARFRLLLDTFTTVEAAWTASPAAWQDAGLDARTAASFEQQRRRIVPAAELERIVKLRVGVLRLTDDAYPRLLREIPLPPSLLYVRGSLTPEDDFAIAVVGTRRATAYGRHVTDRFSEQIAYLERKMVMGIATIDERRAWQRVSGQTPTDDEADEQLELYRRGYEQVIARREREGDW